MFVVVDYSGTYGNRGHEHDVAIVAEALAAIPHVRRLLAGSHHVSAWARVDRYQLTPGSPLAA
jgi:hypothetical protein